MIDRTAIARILPARSRRASSWDTSGGNNDCILIGPGETATLAEIEGAGMITHLYFTMILPNPLDYRDAVLRMYWDGETAPSVEAPFGDFFCIAGCTPRQFASLMVAINPGGRQEILECGMSCYWPMPFARGARITLTNESTRVFGGGLGRLWFHVDYEQYDVPPADGLGRFHAQWRRQNPTPRQPFDPIPGRGVFPARNLDDRHNYQILEAEGEGHVAGLFLEVDNVQGGWWGEGDDMVFIDGEPWPPSIHGTGTEEIFGGGACPNREYTGPYTGFLLVENRGGETFRGLNAMYRWYLQDPIRFRRSVRMSIEHGHANDYANDYASVAFWYQREPHATFPALPGLAARRPGFEEASLQPLVAFGNVCRCLIDFQDRLVFASEQPPSWLAGVRDAAFRGYDALLKGRRDEAASLIKGAAADARRNGYPVAERDASLEDGLQARA